MLLNTRRNPIPQSDLERHHEIRALRKKAKRLRALAPDVGEKRAVKEMSRELDTKASELARGKRDER